MYAVLDPVRYARALKSSHRVHSRIEVFSGHEPLSRDAVWLSATVTDTWTVAGVRRSLSLTVPPTPTWQEWLASGPLVVRPYRGIRHSRNIVQECPMGVFPVLMPERDYTNTENIKITTDDLYQRVGKARFSYPIQTAPQPMAEQIDGLLQGAGLTPAVILVGSNVGDAQTFEDSRSDAIGELAKAGPFEVYIDRDGRTVIDQPRVLETTPAANLIVGEQVIEQVKLKPDWDKVFNQVSIKSTKQDVEFEPVVLSITDRRHPAHPSKMFGYNVKVYSSNTIENREQAVAIAEAMLPKVSGAANTYSYSCIPDARLDAGDTIFASTVDGGTQFCQIQSISTPLEADGRQSITTVSTQLEYEE